jgi:hypothetical protein
MNNRQVLKQATENSQSTTTEKSMAIFPTAFYCLLFRDIKRDRFIFLNRQGFPSPPRKKFQVMNLPTQKDGFATDVRSKGT